MVRSTLNIDENLVKKMNGVRKRIGVRRGVSLDKISWTDPEFTKVMIDLLNSSVSLAEKHHALDIRLNKIGSTHMDVKDVQEAAKTYSKDFLESRRLEVLRLVDEMVKDMMAPVVKNNDALQRATAENYFDRIRKIMEGD